MERVIVTVKRKGDLQGRDLEIPVEMTAGSLIQEVALTLGWGDHYEIYAIPQERVLFANETLAQAEIWDGSLLIFQPTHQTSGIPQSSTPSSNSSPSPTGKPVGSWRSLKANSASSNSNESKKKKTGG